MPPPTMAPPNQAAPGNVVAACPSCNRLKADMLPSEFFMRYPWAGSNFIHHARAVHRALKRQARDILHVEQPGFLEDPPRTRAEA